MELGLLDQETVVSWVNRILTPRLPLWLSFHGSTHCPQAASSEGDVDAKEKRIRMTVGGPHHPLSLHKFSFPVSRGWTPLSITCYLSCLSLELASNPRNEGKWWLDVLLLGCLFRLTPRITSKAVNSVDHFLSVCLSILGLTVTPWLTSVHLLPSTNWGLRV